MKPRLLDLFCGAGGAAMGYHRAGFEFVGVDINPQPHYPFAFHNQDALMVLRTHIQDPLLWGPFDAIHASPPCQAYTRKATDWGRKRNHWTEHPDLLGPTRELLKATGLPYVIENVPGAPIDAQVMLCGTMFPPPGTTGKTLIKHRLFEANWSLPFAPADCIHDDRVYNPWSGPGRSAEKLRDAQGTPWIPMSGGASRKAGVTGDLFNAIPPDFTHWIGLHLMQVVRPSVDGGCVDSLREHMSGTCACPRHKTGSHRSTGVPADSASSERLSQSESEGNDGRSPQMGKGQDVAA